MSPVLHVVNIVLLLVMVGLQLRLATLHKRAFAALDERVRRLETAARLSRL